MLGFYPISALPISGLAWVYQLGGVFRVVEMSGPLYDAIEESGGAYAVTDLSEGIAP